MSPITEKSIGVDGAVFAERRAALRRRVLKGATVSFNNGYSSFECVVRNQSEGARDCRSRRRSRCPWHSGS